jgi:hypothetical protein
MKNLKKNTKRQNEEETSGSRIKKGLLEIGKKLGIAIPAGLLLLCNVNADAATKNHDDRADSKTAKEILKLKNNEIVKHLVSQSPVTMDDKDPLHTNTHSDKDSPNITHTDGDHTNHGNVHTDEHADATRY